MFTSPHALVSFGTFLKRVSSFASTYVSASATRSTVSSRTLSKGGSSRYLLPRVFSDVNFRSQSCILFRKIKVNPYYSCLRHPMKVTKGERVFLDIQCLIQIRACDLKIGKTPDSIESRFFGSYRDCQKVWFFPERVSTEVRTFRSRSQSIVKLRDSYYSTVQCLDYRQYMFTTNVLEMSCEILELIDHN